MVRSFFALLALVALIALPASAVAQSAGDDQYSDPFADTGSGQTGDDSGSGPTGGGQAGGNSGGGQSGGGSGGGNAGSGSAGGDATGGDTPVTSPDTTSAPPDTTTPTASAESSATGTLPHTGFEGIVLLLAAAFPLVVGGAALRRVASESRRR